jgi:hypothetical protein
MKYIASLLVIIHSLTTPAPASAKKAPAKPAAIVQMISPGAERTEPARDAMFKAAFGKAAPVARTIEEQDYSFSPEAVQPLGGDMFALISMGSNDNQGHVSSGMNAVHYLRKTAAGYTVAGEWMGVGTVGTFGQPALSYALTAKLGKNPYLITEAGGTWQGYTCGWTNLTELTPGKPIARGSFGSGYSNSGAAGSKRKIQELEGVIISAIPDTSFTVSFSGTRQLLQTWALGKEEYTLKSKDQIPEC